MVPPEAPKSVFRNLARTAAGASSSIIRWLVAPDRRWRLLVLLGLLAALMGLKAQFDPGLGRPGLDGSFYYQIARNVAEGNGLATNVSLYNQGLQSFPHPTNYCPAWPVLLGLAGKVVKLETAAHILPELLYLLSLILVYFLMNRLVLRAGDTERRLGFLGGRVLDVGHLAVAILGTNRVFFEFTSMPYTEGLGFAALFATLLVADTAARRRSVRIAVVAGALAAVAFLARTQMIGIVLALPAVLAVIGIRDRRFFWMGLAAGLAELIVFLPWALWVMSWHPNLTIPALTGMGTIRETTGLSYFDQTVRSKSAGATLDMALQGLRVAFDPDDKNSYFFSFGWSIFLVPIAFLELAVDWKGMKAFARRFFIEGNILPVTMAISALVMLVPLHIEKKQFFKAWLFGWRHGLPFALLVFLALGFLLMRGQRLARLIAVALVVGALVVGAGNIDTLLDKKYSPGLDGPEIPLVAWLDRQNPKPTVITAHAQILSASSRSYFHWMDCKVPWRHTLTLFDKAGADYLLVYPRHKKCNYFKHLADNKMIERVKTFKRGWTIEVWARSQEATE